MKKFFTFSFIMFTVYLLVLCTALSPKHVLEAKRVSSVSEDGVYKGRQFDFSMPNLTRQAEVAKQNILKLRNNVKTLKDAQYVKFAPGEAAASFRVPSLSGYLEFPGKILLNDTPVIFAVYSKYSGFLQCLWNCTESIEDFIITTPAKVNYVFLSESDNSLADAVWMKNRFDKVIKTLSQSHRCAQTHV